MQLSDSIQVSASILSADLGNLNQEVLKMELAGVDRIHYDVMDGHFVDNLSYGVPLLRKMKVKVPVEMHLMVDQPSKFFEDYKNIFEEPGRHTMLAHVEVCDDVRRLVAKIKASGFRVGLVLKPETSIEVILPVLDQLDQVLIMSVEPGYGSQKFRSEVLMKVKKLREFRADLDIEMDGGINAETGVLAREAGANVLVSGSFLFASPDPKEAVRVLKGLT